MIRQLRTQAADSIDPAGKLSKFAQMPALGGAVPDSSPETLNHMDTIEQTDVYAAPVLNKMEAIRARDFPGELGSTLRETEDAWKKYVESEHECETIVSGIAELKTLQTQLLKEAGMKMLVGYSCTLYTTASIRKSLDVKSSPGQKFARIRGGIFSNTSTLQPRSRPMIFSSPVVIQKPPESECSYNLAVSPNSATVKQTTASSNEFSNLHVSTTPIIRVEDTTDSTTSVNMSLASKRYHNSKACTYCS